MKKAGNWVASAFRPTVLFVAMCGFVLLLLWFLLGGLLPGMSHNELVQQAGSATWHAIYDNPLGAPYKIVQFIPQYFKHQDIWLLRSASALFGFVVAGCFYYVINQWYTRRVAMLGTLLFVCSAWFLHTARLGTESIMYGLLIAAVAITVWLQKSRGNLLAVLCGAALVITLLYMPGMIWFVVPALFWQAKRIGEFLKGQHPALLTLLSLVALVALVPLAWGMYREPSLIRTYFGLPHTFPAPFEIIKNIVLVPYRLFFRGPGQPEIWLGRLPLLDWFGTAMFAVGAYAYFHNRRLDRTMLFAYVGVVGAILIGLGGPVTMTILLPFVYLIIASGIAMLLQQWFTVFPENPVAKTIGATLMTIAVIFSAYYNINHYFIAWPNAPETKQVFQEKP